MNSSNNNQQTHQELLMLFPVIADDIKNAKRQQWSIGYYGLIIYAAIMGFIKVKFAHGNPNEIEKCFIISLSIIVLVLCILYLIENQLTLRKYRIRLGTIIDDYFSDDTAKIVPPPKHYKGLGYYFDIPTMIIYLLIGGVSLVAWTLYADKALPYIKIYLYLSIPLVIGIIVNICLVHCRKKP